MNVLVSGATGLIGSALVSALAGSGHRVWRLTRRVRSEEDIAWDPAEGMIQHSRLHDFDAVAHLAGEPILGLRWTPQKKARIRESRVRGTDFLCRRLAEMDRRPRVLVCASAIGFYGDRGDEVLDETSSSGSDFLAEVCQAWEAAAAPAASAGIRVVNLRLGVVLSPRGGALGQMLPPFSLGLGGRLGSGRQYVSWIALEDVVGAIAYAMANDSLAGPVNAVAPNPVTNDELTRTLGAVLRRPTLLPAPAAIVRLVLGEMSQPLLGSARVIPRKLQQSGYHFRFARLDEALRHLLGKSAAAAAKTA